MQITMILPAIAALSIVAFLLFTAFYRPARGAWVIPAALSTAFLAFSLYTIQQEGILGLWTNPTQNLWGNQIWIDLLLAIGIAWVFILPEARRLKMSIVPWAIAIVLTGCIGVLAMVARLFWLREKEPA